MGDAVVGRDVVLKETEILSDLLKILPHKAQLGFSSLKEQFSQRGDQGIKKFFQHTRPHDPLKLEYTCLDITDDLAVLGSNFGIVFFYDRRAKKLSRFICEAKQAPIVSVRLLASQKFVSVGQFNGAFTIFNYAEEKNGIYKVALKCTVNNHHSAPVTCIQWTPDGTKLFTADSEGNVAITVINMDEGQTHTVFICKEDSPVIQLSFCHTALLISTLRRSLIWPFNTKKIVQVGQQERKIHGNFGACFYPPSKPIPSDLSPFVYAVRPGLRIWKATLEGKVQTTMMFKESINKGEPEIRTLNLPSSNTATPQTEQKQFGPLVNFNEVFLLSWQGSCLWVVDPNTGSVVGCHSNLGCVVDVALYNNNVYVLTKGEEHFIRKITFSLRAESPVIEVRELNLDNVDNEKDTIHRTASWGQFEGDAKLDKLIDDVGSTMVGIISGVQRKVVKTIEHMTARDESEEGLSSEDAYTSGNASSPNFTSRRTIHRNVPVKSQNGIVPNGNVTSGLGSSPEPYSTSLNNSNEASVNIVEDESTTQETVNASPDHVDDNGTDNFGDEKDDLQERKIEVVIEHKLKEKPLPFDHLSHQELPDIVFEGTSKKKTKSRSKKKQIRADFTEDYSENQQGEISSIDDESAVQFFNGQVDEEEKSTCEGRKHRRQRSLGKFRPPSIHSPSEDFFEAYAADFDKTGKVNGIHTDKTKEIISTADQNNEQIVFSDHEESETVAIESEIEKASPDINSDLTNDSEHIEIPKKKTQYLVDDNGKETSDLNGSDEPDDNVAVSEITEKVDNLDLKQTLCDDELFDSISSQIETAKGEDNFEQFSPKLTDDDEAQFAIGQSPIVSDSSESNVEQSNKDFESEVKKDEIVNAKTNEIYDTQETPDSSGGDNFLEPSEVLNVEITTGDNKLLRSGSNEKCKKVEGEAVEKTRTHKRSNSDVISIGGEDLIESNLCWSDEDNERIDVVEEIPKRERKETPLFPAPQMSAYSSIYSQDTVSLSEMSFSEPEPSLDSMSLNEFKDADAVIVKSQSFIDSDELTDVEDNRADSPPVNLDSFGGVEMHDVTYIRKRNASNSGKSSDRASRSSSPAILEYDYPEPLSPSAVAEKLSERLRLLADCWAEITVPTCGQVQSVNVNDNFIWCVDHHDHIFITPSSSSTVNWKKMDGRARLIASNQNGTIVWSVDRKKVAHYRTNIKENNLQGSDWEPVEKDVLEVAVDDDCVWGIKTNGDVFVRTGVSSKEPAGTGWKSIRMSSDLVHITCLDGIVWALDIYNHVQIYTGNVHNPSVHEQDVLWHELPGINASYVSLGPKGTCWIVDRDGNIWFNLEISKDFAFGGKWYQLSLGEYLVEVPTMFSTVLSFFKRGNEPKIIVGNDISGIWILGKHGSLHAARGHLLGTRWNVTVPLGMSLNVFWSCVSSQGATGNGGFIWSLQPNGELHCFRPEGRSFVVQPPPRTLLKFITASSRSLWALTSSQDVYFRRGISDACPQGLKWAKVDMTTAGTERICNICCGNLVVWAIDYTGNVWFQMGKDDRRLSKYGAAWVQVEGSPFEGCQFTKIVVGANDCVVWAVDDRNNVYARKDVTENFSVGTSWDVVPGTGAKDLAISDDIVWALRPNGDVLCRFGVSDKNFMGDYWKKVPGCFDQISVTADDELWGIDRQGQLYQRQTIHFFGTQATEKAPSYSQLFPTDEDWELI